MTDLQKLFIQRECSSEIFFKKEQKSFREILGRATDCTLHSKKSEWIVMIDENNPANLMTGILSCIHHNQNFIIACQEDISHEELEAYPKIYLSNISEHTFRKKSEVHKEKQEKTGFKFNDVFFGFLTSGSSGKSKIIIHPISNLMTNALHVNNLLEVKRGTIFQLALPTYHIAGLAILFRAFFNGSPLNHLHKKDLETENLKGVISLVSAQIPILLKNKNISPKELILFIGGGKINLSHLSACINARFPTFTSYGMSETASTFSIKKQTTDKLNSSIGKPIANGEFSIINQILYIKTPVLFAGELINGEIVKASLSNNFYRTNDRAKIEGDEIYLLGREDEIIVSGGKNISLKRISEMIESRFSELDYQLITHPHQKWGESYSIFIMSDGTINHLETANELKSNLKNEYSPFTIHFLTGEEEYKGIKPSKQELLDLLAEDLKKVING